MTETGNKVIKAIEDNSEYITGNLYDFIANEYYGMSNGELKDVLLEVIYSYDYKMSKEDLIYNLKERFGE